jgi:hypothetical protein
MLRPSLPVYPVSGQFQSPSACLKGANSFRWRPLAAVQARISTARCLGFPIGARERMVHAGNQRRQRRDHLLHQLLDSAAEHPQRSVDHLPGRQLRFAVKYPKLFVRHVSMFLSE